MTSKATPKRMKSKATLKGMRRSRRRKSEEENGGLTRSLCFPFRTARVWPRQTLRVINKGRVNKEPIPVTMHKDFLYEMTIL